MRKIEQDMIAAIRAMRETWKSDNTAVDSRTGQVFLHGHCIARTTAAGNWEFNLCGWNTPTTRSRINAIAREFGRAGVYNTARKPYLDDRECTPVPTEGWF